MMYSMWECLVVVEVISLLTDYKYQPAEESGHSPFMSQLHDVVPEAQQNADVGSLVWFV